MAVVVLHRGNVKLNLSTNRKTSNVEKQASFKRVQSNPLEGIKEEIEE